MLSKPLAPVLLPEFKRKGRYRVWLTKYRQDGS